LEEQAQKEMGRPLGYAPAGGGKKDMFPEKPYEDRRGGLSKANAKASPPWTGIEAPSPAPRQARYEKKDKTTLTPSDHELAPKGVQGRLANGRGGGAKKRRVECLAGKRAAVPITPRRKNATECGNCGGVLRERAKKKKRNRAPGKSTP